MTRGIGRKLLVFSLGASLWAALPRPVVAAPDFAAESNDWNGLSELVRIGAEAGVALRIPEALDLGHAAPEDALLIVHPTRALPLGSLTEFVKRGGRLAIADDFGRADSLLAVWGMRRTTPIAGDPPRLRGNGALLLALPPPGLTHPLSENVRALITNHPAALTHDTLEPIFAFGPERQALVLSGSVGEGRVVALADPSVLINNMLQFRGNREFARNLLEHLEGGRGGRVFVITGDTPLFERVSHGNASPAARLRDFLDRLAAADVPPLALQIASLLLVSLLVVFASSTLPRRSPYRPEWLLPPSSPGTGYAGRMAFFSEHPAHLVHPALAHYAEIVSTLQSRLGLPSTATLPEIARALRQTDVDPRDARRLLVRLNAMRRIEVRAQRSAVPPRIRPRFLESMIETGERVFERLPGGNQA